MVRLHESDHAPCEIMRRALYLGRVLALTRNENGAIETTGVAMRIPKQAEQGSADEAGREARNLSQVEEAQGWFNALDPDFNLHLRDSALRSRYVVRRAGVTSVELFDDQGELVVTFFGVRERGKPQPQSWLDLAASLPKA